MAARCKRSVSCAAKRSPSALVQYEEDTIPMMRFFTLLIPAALLGFAVPIFGPPILVGQAFRSRPSHI